MKESGTPRIRLELTADQREQIRKATGRRVNVLDLGFGSETKPVADGVPAPVPATRRARRKDEVSAA
jgi:hypothetical protein